MADPLATIDDYQGLHGDLGSDERRTRVTVLLGQASALLRSKAPDIDARITSGALDPALAVAAVVGMVWRVADRPQPGLRSETRGPFSRSWDSTAAGSQLQVLAEDLALVSAPATSGTPRAGTIRVGAGLASCPPAGWSSVGRW